MATAIAAPLSLPHYPSAGDLPASGFTAGDDTGMTIDPAHGADLLLVVNTVAAAATITLTSAADQYGRTGDPQVAAIALDDYAIFRLKPRHLLAESSGLHQVTQAGGGGTGVLYRLLKLN